MSLFTLLTKFPVLLLNGEKKQVVASEVYTDEIVVGLQQMEQWWFGGYFMSWFCTLCSSEVCCKRFSNFGCVCVTGSVLPWRECCFHLWPLWSECQSFSRRDRHFPFFHPVEQFIPDQVATKKVECRLELLKRPWCSRWQGRINRHICIFLFYLISILHTDNSLIHSEVHIWKGRAFTTAFNAQEKRKCSISHLVHSILPAPLYCATACAQKS